MLQKFIVIITLMFTVSCSNVNSLSEGGKYPNLTKQEQNDIFEKSIVLFNAIEDASGKALTLEEKAGYLANTKGHYNKFKGSLIEEMGFTKESFPEIVSKRYIEYTYLTSLVTVYRSGFEGPGNNRLMVLLEKSFKPLISDVDMSSIDYYVDDLCDILNKNSINCDDSLKSLQKSKFSINYGFIKYEYLVRKNLTLDQLDNMYNLEEYIEKMVENELKYQNLLIN